MDSKEQNGNDGLFSESSESTETQHVVVEQDLEEQISAEGNTVDATELRIAELEAQLIFAQKNERDALLRAKAEVENIRRRTEQDIEKAHKFALERFSNELLPVIDNLERALSSVDTGQAESQKIIEGLELTLKSFLDTMLKFGVDPIHEKNVPFNPELHQAMSMIESSDHETNQVIDVMQKGYILNGRLLRPAMVVVAK